MNKEKVLDISMILVGNLLLASGIAFFIIPNSILAGGVAGIAVAVEPLINVKPQTVINFLTIALFVVGALVLGKKFAIKSLFSAFAYPLLLSVITYFIEQGGYEEMFIMNPFLASIYGGALVGFGIGFVFRSGSSTGGMDIPPLIINKYTHIPIPTLVLITDAITVMLGMFVFGLEAALIGILSVWVCSYAINKTMLLGAQNAKNVLIISEHTNELISAIYQDLDRGCTLLKASGGYTKQDRNVIMTVVVNKQLPALLHLIPIIDPQAFVIVNDTNEVQGEGFSYEQAM